MTIAQQLDEAFDDAYSEAASFEAELSGISPTGDHMSINDFTQLVQGAANSAHGAARAGSHIEEYQQWVRIAGVALVRAAQVKDKF